VPYSISTKFAIHTGNVWPGISGWPTRRPVSKPRFSAASITASLVPMLRHCATKACAAWSRAATAAETGCSGANATNDMPNSVSGRVVNTSTSASVPDSGGAVRGKRTRAPSLRPIQRACMVRTRSGQRSSPSSAASRSGAYWVMRKNHWESCRFSTTAPDRQPRPSMTCSLASTVPSTGSQLTQLSLRSTSPACRKSRNSFCWCP